MRASALLDPSFGKTSRCPLSGTNGWRPSQIAFLFQASGSESIEAPSLHFGERSQTGIIEWRLRTACDILHKLVEESTCIVAGVHQTRALWVMDGRPNGMVSIIPRLRPLVGPAGCKGLRCTTNVTAGVTIGPLPHGESACTAFTPYAESNSTGTAQLRSSHFVARSNHRKYKYLKEWSEWQDSNLRPLRPEPGYRAASR